MPEGGVSAAYSLTRKLSSSRPLSSARIAVITLVVLAGGSGSVEFRSQTTSPVRASMMTAARAVMYGPAARPGTGAASAQPTLARQIGHAAAGILHRQLEDRRQPAKGRMPRNRDQPMADAPFPRHLMSVPAAPDRPLAVVQMERHQSLEEPLAAQRVRQAVPRLGPRQVEPRGVQMAGVDEDAQAVGGRAHVAYQPAHLGHVGAELAALAGVLEDGGDPGRRLLDQRRELAHGLLEGRLPVGVTLGEI